MLSYFDSSHALVNGCDNIADVILSIDLVLFSLWLHTGITPFYKRVRTENLTVSGSLKTKLDLKRLAGIASCSEDLEVKYDTKKFPGLSVVQDREEMQSTKGVKRKLSIELFQEGSTTLVGLKSIEDVYLRADHIRRFEHFFLEKNAEPAEKLDPEQAAKELEDSLCEAFGVT
jgi:TATA-box binding protein (TBP) (component of TFIID and TFIIIB)